MSYHLFFLKNDKKSRLPLVGEFWNFWNETGLFSCKIAFCMARGVEIAAAPGFTELFQVWCG